MKNFLIYLVSASLFIISCQKIFFDDDESTRELFFEDFHTVKISGIYNIVLIQDSTNRLVITGNNHINSIDASVHNDVLIIDDPSKMSFNTNKNTLALHFSNLNYMVTFNPVNISNVDTIKADWFSYDAIVEVAEVNLVVDCNYFSVGVANTLGDFHLSGKANYCDLYCLYGCNFFAGNLSCRYAYIYNESVGDVYVKVSEKLTVSIGGPGNIYYYGTPVIEIEEKRGDGKIIHLN